jgi:glucan phosphoethanolaminetransferase (alkaline phosphatase superfamily)
MRELYRIVLKFIIAFGICMAFGLLLSFLTYQSGESIQALTLALTFFLAVVFGMWIGEDL